MDTPQPLDPSWSMARVERCYKQIWGTASRVAARDVPCVLDLGFSRTESRARFAELTRDAGLSARLHFVAVPAEERWRRVEARNAKKRRDVSAEIRRYARNVRFCRRHLGTAYHHRNVEV
ncbi:MAG: hypothetical protein EXQ84_04400 [Rhodospirillaceae bacterium]|nr:hypothetical protein [Rhodospirillaceae bacterium]